MVERDLWMTVIAAMTSSQGGWRDGGASQGTLIIGKFEGKRVGMMERVRHSSGHSFI